MLCPCDLWFRVEKLTLTEDVVEETTVVVVRLKALLDRWPSLETYDTHGFYYLHSEMLDQS